MTSDAVIITVCSSIGARPFTFSLPYFILVSRPDPEEVMSARLQVCYAVCHLCRGVMVRVFNTCRGEIHLMKVTVSVYANPTSSFHFRVIDYIFRWLDVCMCVCVHLQSLFLVVDHRQQERIMLQEFI